MQMKRGCGCLMIVLALVNLLVAISAVAGLVSGDISVPVSLVMLGVFLANVAVCAITGYQTVRFQAGEKSSASATDETEGEQVEDEDDGDE